MTAHVEVLRGSGVESVHDVDVAVVAADGRAVRSAGDPGRLVFARSAVKPFQAMPLLADGVADRFGLSDQELAVCCASHNGERVHVEAVRSILAKAGVGEDALACGPHAPFDEAAATALRDSGRQPGRIHNNCSGKHAGMLLLARAHGWPLAGYERAGHPVQERMHSEVARWCGLKGERIATAVDGCGVVTFQLPLSALAAAFARLVTGDDGAPESRVVAAMVAHPHLVAGTGRLCTRLLEATGGRIVAKVGAEGVYGAADRERGLGIALKVRDGARRAAEVALLAVLEALRSLRPEERDGLRAWARPEIRNTRDEVVGEVRPRVELHPEIEGED